jgi:hypothetical protein
MIRPVPRTRLAALVSAAVLTASLALVATPTGA